MKSLVRLLKRDVTHRRITPARVAATCLVALAVSGASSLVPAPVAAEAQEEVRPNFGRDGLYMGGRAVYALSQWQSQLPQVLCSDFFPQQAAREDCNYVTPAKVDNGKGFGFWVGYRFHRFLAGEVDFEIMDPGYKVSASHVDHPVPEGDHIGLPDVGSTLRNFGMTAYAKMYPLAVMPAFHNFFDRFQPFIKIGLGFQYYHQKDGDEQRGTRNFSGTGFVSRFGGGLDFYLSKRIALTWDATYTLTTGPIAGFNSWSIGVIGLQWRFGGD